MSVIHTYDHDDKGLSHISPKSWPCNHPSLVLSVMPSAGCQYDKILQKLVDSYMPDLRGCIASKHASERVSWFNYCVKACLHHVQHFPWPRILDCVK